MSIKDEKAKLIKRAKRLGVDNAESLGIKDLRAVVNSFQSEPESPPSDTNRKLNALKEATKLRRIIATCMNSRKKSGNTHYFEVSNDEIGTIKRYVPMNTPKGTHVEDVIYQNMLARECVVFVDDVNTSNGRVKVKSETIKEYSITLLPPLTEDELKELGREQSAHHSIDK